MIHGQVPASSGAEGHAVGDFKAYLVLCYRVYFNNRVVGAFWRLWHLV